VEIYRKFVCIICVIEMSGSMLGSMPEVVQQAEMPFLTIAQQLNSTRRRVELS